MLYTYGTLAVVPFQTKFMSYFFIFGSNCGYAESYGWFLSGENADASHAIYLVPDDSSYSGLALSFGVRSKALTLLPIKLGTQLCENKDPKGTHYLVKIKTQ